MADGLDGAFGQAPDLSKRRNGTVAGTPRWRAIAMNEPEMTQALPAVHLLGFAIDDDHA